MKVIITGSTGMVGRGVLYECLDHPKVKSVLVINRHSLKMNHPKLKEIIHQNFCDLSPIKHEFADYDAIFHCMGVSVVGLNEKQYSKITFDVTKAFVDTLHEFNPDMIFNYVSGTGTDETEKGRIMWARIKGKAENYIINKGFKHTYMFRPGAIIPEKGIQSKTGWYNAVYLLLKPFFPLLKKSKHITTTTKIGKTMINSTLMKFNHLHLENKHINLYADKKLV